MGLAACICWIGLAFYIFNLVLKSLSIRSLGTSRECKDSLDRALKILCSVTLLAEQQGAEGTDTASLLKTNVAADGDAAKYGGDALLAKYGGDALLAEVYRDKTRYHSPGKDDDKPAPLAPTKAVSYAAAVAPYPPPSSTYHVIRGLILPVGSTAKSESYATLIDVDTAADDWCTVLSTELLRCQSRVSAQETLVTPASVAIVLALRTSRESPEGAMIAFTAATRMLQAFYGSNVVENGILSVPTVIVSSAEAVALLHSAADQAVTMLEQEEADGDIIMVESQAAAPEHKGKGLVPYSGSDDDDEVEDEVVTETDAENRGEVDSRGASATSRPHPFSLRPGYVQLEFGKRVAPETGEVHLTDASAAEPAAGVANTVAARQKYRERRAKRQVSCYGIVPLNECADMGFTPSDTKAFALRNAVHLYKLQRAIPESDNGHMHFVFCCYCWSRVPCWEPPSRLIGKKFSRHRLNCKPADIPLPADFSERTWVEMVMVEHAELEKTHTQASIPPPPPPVGNDLPALV